MPQSCGSGVHKFSGAFSIPTSNDNHSIIVFCDVSEPKNGMILKYIDLSLPMVKFCNWHSFKIIGVNPAFLSVV